MKKFVINVWYALMCAVISAHTTETVPEETHRSVPAETAVPLLTAFDNIGENALHTLAFNHGANFAFAGLGTWLFIESGVDWKWRNFAYDHETLANSAYSSVVYAGYAVPSATPVAFYLAGLFRHDEKLQITGLALVQSMAFAAAAQAILKSSTGRSEPYIIGQYHHTRLETQTDFSGEFDWFKTNILDGWPSGHTMSAFAVASTVAQMYHDNICIKIASFSYALLVGIGVSLSVHWASDVVAGALMGYAIGTTVGRSFSAQVRKTPHKEVSLSVSAQTLGIMVRF